MKIYTLDSPQCYFTRTIGESRVLCIALCFADSLQNHLFGRLGSNPSKVPRGTLNHDGTPEFGAGIDVSYLVQRDLCLLVLNDLNDLFDGKNPDITRIGLNLGFDVGSRTKVSFVR